jgi:hypothetical protein
MLKAILSDSRALGRMSGMRSFSVAANVRSKFEEAFEEMSSKQSKIQ